MTDLDPKLTFDTFVVGPANRLASAAARRAADSPGTSYNPLFVYSASGLGKTHILAAVAHHAARVNPRQRVLYQALESFLDELTRALEAGKRDEMKDRYRDLDFLLLDDVQFLAGQPEAQEMLLGTLDALTASGSQVVLASDRPPAEINELDARLVSRFNGGLIVDIAAPEYETRVAIIRRKAQELGADLQPGVAEALARISFRNVRELTGALTRVVAIQDLEERSVGPREIARLMGQDDEGDDREPPDGYESFLDELSTTVASTVEAQEEAWRKLFREVSESAERQGFVADRLRNLMEADEAPDDWESVADRFKSDVARLRAIDSELDDLGNPWPEAAQGVVRDPDRLEEAEALLASVRERVRPFPPLAAGPTLDDVTDDFPQLAVKALEQLVTAEKPKYNPIYLWSDDDAPARALLAAAGRTFQEVAGGRRMAVTSLAAFAEDFIRALSSGVAGAWRERWWTVDLLLVHGAQELSHTERAQDEFFHLFEALKRRGARVLLAADRPPSGIEGIDERLRSRFEGGLVLDVNESHPPEGADEIVLAEEAAGAEPAGEGGGDIWAGTEEAAPAPLPVAEPAGAPVPEAGGGGGARARPGGRQAFIPPLEELISGERGGLFFPEDEDEDGDGGWRPTRETVVWTWPRVEDRLVEDLD